MGLNVEYALAWLRQKENQYLACPPSIAKDLPTNLQNLIGYALGGYGLGYWGDIQGPKKAFSQALPVNWASDWQQQQQQQQQSLRAEQQASSTATPRERELEEENRALKAQLAAVTLAHSEGKSRL